jgi:hypothetical protein
MYIAEHILKGDRSDGIPNFLSDDDTFVAGKRQRPMSKIKLARWVDQSPEMFTDDITLKNYYRNQKLIDFEFIPKEVSDNIINTFENTETPARGKMYPYFMRHALNEMLDHITEF